MIRLLLLPLLTAVTHATDHKVLVGNRVYNPANITAIPGDTITFQFHEGNYTVTQATFDSPCTSRRGGFDTGFMPITSETTPEFPNYTITVNDTNPIWAYCAQTVPRSYCSFGMVFSANAPRNDFHKFRMASISIGGQSLEGWSAPGEGSTFCPNSLHTRSALRKRSISPGLKITLCILVADTLFVAGAFYVFPYTPREPEPFQEEVVLRWPSLREEPPKDVTNGIWVAKSPIRANTTWNVVLTSYHRC